ncbi:MAG TPA: CD225/dispanin family protein [bacterium]|nr:CD225/dispanin family protein [bacterium]
MAENKSVPNYLVQAILCTIFCCLPFGIVAIVYAAQVNGKVEAGDMAGAQAASKTAKTWCWVAFGVGLAVILLYVLTVGAAVLIPAMAHHS